MVIGLTGQIGAGKTTAAEILRSFGAEVIDADRIGREVVDRSTALRRRLARAFGADILTPTGRLRRERLAERAFADPQAKATLDRLVHPPLLRELRRQVRAAERRGRVAVIDAALLLDWELDREVDCVLVIHASKARRLERLRRRGMSQADARARLRRQLPLREYRRRADRVISNDGSRAELRARRRRFWDKCMDGHAVRKRKGRR